MVSTSFFICYLVFGGYLCFFAEDLDGTAGCLNSLDGLLGEAVSLYDELCLDLTVGENLDKVVLGGHASLAENIGSDLGDVRLLSESLEHGDVDCLILNSVAVLETELRQTTL